MPSTIAPHTSFAVLPDGRKRNLHELWDTALIEQRFSGRHEVAVAKRLVRDNSVRAGKWKSSSVEEWMTESHSIARELAYGALPGFACGRLLVSRPIRLSEAYLQQAGAAAEEQLARAGYRLASTLNLAFGR